MLVPVCGELGEGGGAQDERRSGHGREVAIEGGD